jgi:serine/threonine protein kinase
MRELAISGKILGGRYRIVKVLGSGGFSETYIAEDIQRPNNPLCVVKQLRPANNKPKQLEVARRLFKLEAETLEKLGIHPQIPQLLAYFEQDEEFYLIQELIVGHPLSQELIPGKTIIEPAVIQILQNLLQTLAFVHSHGVIHRDIKPSNIIRRHSDGKLVLIDFGAVKEVTTQMLESEGQTGYTIGIGTQGYAPNEQCAGRPQFSSDIYAVGMIGIKALTGLAPHELVDLDANGELRWTHKAKVSSSLANVISKMVLYDYKQRYQTASEALAALQQLVSNEGRDSLPVDNYSLENTLPLEDLDAPTAPWPGASEDKPSSSSSTTSMWPPQ